MKPVGKPDAGNPHVRFDERGRETECCRMAQATAPVLDSTPHTLLTVIAAYLVSSERALLKGLGMSLAAALLQLPRWIRSASPACRSSGSMPNRSTHQGP